MCRVFKIVTFPARLVLNFAMDVAFGKADDYVSRTNG